MGEDLEMAWELASETDEGSFSPKFLLSLIDDGFFKAPTDAYARFGCSRATWARSSSKTWAATTSSPSQRRPSKRARTTGAARCRRRSRSGASSSAALRWPEDHAVRIDRLHRCTASRFEEQVPLF